MAAQNLYQYFNHPGLVPSLVPFPLLQLSLDYRGFIHHRYPGYNNQPVVFNLGLETR